MYEADFKSTQKNENLPEKLSQPLPRTSSTPQVHKQHSSLNHYIWNKTARVKIKTSLHELRVEKQVLEDCLVKIFGHGRKAVEENQKQIAGEKTVCPYVYENVHQLVGVNIQNDQLKTRVLRCYFSAGRNVARCHLNLASGWLLGRVRRWYVGRQVSFSVTLASKNLCYSLHEREIAS